MIWSFSRVNGFKNCPYAWLKQYVFNEDRMGGYYGEYGSYLHKILEMYFKQELQIYELPQYYEEHYAKNVVSEPPPKPIDLAEKYYAQGLEYFENFEFPHDKYEILGVEIEIKFFIGKYKFTGFIDLLLKDKTTGKIISVDYKSSDPYKGSKTPNKQKLQEYKRQQYLYGNGIKDKLGILPSQFELWFLRFNKKELFDFDEIERLQSLDWAESEIEKIMAESDWKPLSSYWWCSYLCSVRNGCEYKG